MDFEKVITTAAAQGASDVHLPPGLPIFFRINGEIIPHGTEKVSNEGNQQLLAKLLSEKHKTTLQEQRQVDFVVRIQQVRLRGNAFFQERGLSVSFRIIPEKILEFNSLGFPKFLTEKLMKLKHGLVLVVGPTGHGKTTTLASILQEKNKTQAAHIITIEDPIEYLLPSEKSVIQQREVGRDVISFKDGIRAALRADPNVLMVGEMRDLKTISAALTMAETGHVVFSTLHTNNGPQTITRIIDVFPPEHQDQIRTQLASTLAVVISQRLVPTIDKKGRVLAYEILMSNYAVRNYIRQNKIFQIPNVIQTDASGEMIQLEHSLAELVMSGKISKEVAHEYAHDRDQLRSILEMNKVK